MKKSIFTPIVMALIAALCCMPTASAQSGDDKATIEDVKQETRDLITALKSYTAEQRDEAIRQADQALKKLDSRIDALESRIDKNWDQMDKAAREKARASMQALHRQRTELAEWYGGFKNSSVSAWDQVKKGFSDAYQAFIDSWEKAEDEYKEDNKES
jgi:septal ring factor EnvC (AmiA/AmiB activator)